MDEVFCPSCRARIAANTDTCPVCGSAAASRLRAVQHAQQTEAMARVATGRPDVNLSHLPASAQAKFLKNTGQGLCGQCRSQNVVNVRLVEGGSQAWFAIHMTSALFWFFVSGPISCVFFGPSGGFLLGLVPFFICAALAFVVRPKGAPGRECRYCGHRWRL